MHKITAVYRAAGANPNVHISDFPDRCPLCHETGLQTFLQSAYFSGRNENQLTLAMRCPSQRCNEVYLAIYSATPVNGNPPPMTMVNCSLIHCTPIKASDYKADPILDEVSTQFRKIAAQAHGAEQAGYTEVCGPGYRKALEFLVKDFLIKHTFKEDPEKQGNVRKMALANVIANYIPHERIKALAARAAWLGNDETHYERVHDDHDLQDLKNLLYLTALYIAAELHAEQYTAALQKPSQA